MVIACVLKATFSLAQTANLTNDGSAKNDVADKVSILIIVCAIFLLHWMFQKVQWQT